MTTTTSRHGFAALSLCAALLTVGTAFGQFTPGNLAVLRLGDGTAVIDSTAQPLFIDEYDATTGALVASHPIPSTGATALTLGGRGEHDGHLNLSSNGRYLLLGGYRADAGSPDPVPANDLRVIGRIDSAWNVDTTTTLEVGAYDRTYLTSVVSDNGERFWTVGDGKYVNLDDVANNFLTPTTSGGLRYVDHLGASSSINVGHVQTITYDSTGKVQGLWPDSMRNARIVDGQLYVTTPAKESFVNRGLYATADPLPISGPQSMIPIITNIEGQPPDPTGKFVPKSDIILLDLDGVPGIDTAYSTGGKNDYEKWALVDGVWELISTQLLPSGEEINALDALVEGTTVTLFASTDQGIYKLVDSSGYNADFNDFFPLTPFITPGSGTEFRGIALLPEPHSLILFGLAALALRRRRTS